MPFRLLVRSRAQTGEAAPQELLLQEDAVTVGRDKGCQVVLADPAVSRRHLSITREDTLYFLADLGSSFGTRVNGAAMPAKEKRLLRDGDVIAVGPYDLTFDRAPEAPSPVYEKTAFVSKREVKDALRGLATEAPYLRVMNGPLEGSRIEILEAKEVVIGREPGVDILLDDDLTSRRHAKVRRDWSGTRIEDLGSRNGLKVNRQRVSSETLKDRDEIEIGGTRFLFIDPSAIQDPVVVAARLPGPVRRDADGNAGPTRERSASAAPRPAGVPPPETRPQSAEPADAPAGPPPQAAEPEAPAPAEEAAPEEAAQESAAVRSPPAAVRPAPPEDSAESPAEGRPPAPPGSSQLRRLITLAVVVGVALFAVAVLLIAIFST